MSDAKIISLNDARTKKEEEHRRVTERTIYTRLMGVYSVTGANTMSPIEIIDMSVEGLSFRVPFNKEGGYPKDQNIPLRLYFSHETYIPIRVHIKNARPLVENGVKYLRYGCSIDQEAATYGAYYCFVQFMKQYSKIAVKDIGDLAVG